MNFNIENIENIVVLTILDATLEGVNSAELKSRILILAQPNIKAFILDLTNIAIIDSSGLGALLLANRQLEKHNIPVILVGVQNFVNSLLELTHTKNIFKYYPTSQDAIDDNI